MTIKIEIAKPAQKKLKILFYGPAGSGKTLAALSFPRALMIDAESGSDLYAGRPGIAEFYRVHAKNISDVNEVLDAIEADKGKTWDTLIIDPVTVMYDVEKNVQTVNNTKDMTFKGWSKVNTKMTALYNRLANLDVHVLIIAREAVEYEGEGLNLRKVGVKPEIDKKSAYLFDFVVRLKTDHSGIVEKSRGVELGKAGQLPAVNWKAFEDTASLYVKGEKATTETDEAAAEKELNVWNKDNTEAWIDKWEATGVSKLDLQKALGITGKWSNWKGTVKEADAKVEATRKPKDEVTDPRETDKFIRGDYTIMDNPGDPEPPAEFQQGPSPFGGKPAPAIDPDFAALPSTRDPIAALSMAGQYAEPVTVEQYNIDFDTVPAK